MSASRKILLGCGAGLLLLLAVIFISRQPIDLPPLTHTHQFSNCPFNIKLPGEPEIMSNEQTEQIGVIEENYIIIASCNTFDKINSVSDNILEIAEDYMKINLSLDDYKSAEIIPIDFNSEYAVLRYSANGKNPRGYFNVAGAVYSSQKSFLDIEISYIDKVKKDDLDKVFESVDVN